MSIIISIAVQKGGVGKTTTVVTTAHALGELGKKVLVVDLDPQHNASLTLGKVAPYEQPRTVIDLFKNKTVTFSTSAVPSKYQNVDLISSHIDLFGVGENLGGSNPKGIVGLKNKLDKNAIDTYDIILIDCPPALGGPFVNNALVISDYFIIPIEAESYYALKGIQQFQEAVGAIQETINPDLKFMSALVTMYDSRTNVSASMVEGIKRFFGEENVFKTVINRNTAINKAALDEKTIIAYDSRMPGAKDYRAFGGEVVEWLDKNHR